MTAKYNILFFFAFFLLALGCSEIPPVVTPDTGGSGGPGGPLSQQPRQVLIEEFTGIRCVNCPAGSEAIETLLGIHGTQLVAVSIHAGFFSLPPYPESRDTLATATGRSILSLLGSPLGYPTAVVNRKQFDGEENRQIGQSSWPGYIAEELLTPPRIRIGLETSFDSASRQLTVDTDLFPTEDINEPDVRLTVYLIENKVIDSQLTPAGQVNDYEHKHVFREALTPFDGERLTEDLRTDQVVRRSYTFTVPAKYEIENCHVVSFVSLGGSDLEVLQAHEVPVVE
ncbi:MAG: hypothetical protein D6772_14140 [Bacteroidetes bacterium]|nr:MAG: hypothetical protein D6772_14140 [Bacteroidota bacterium]